MKALWVVVCLVLASSASRISAAEPSARAVFEQLKTLVGTWKSTTGATVANYTTIANGNALIENWAMSPTRQSMTVYTMDGDRLLATHYCPQGNAPRLRLVSTDKLGAHHFMFLDGANLQDPSGSHEHVFWIRLEPSGTLMRSETYISNAATYKAETDLGEQESFIRIAPRQ